MRSKYSVKLKTIVTEHNLRPIHLAKDYEQAVLTTADVNRPAMQLTGFYNYFDPRRLQIIGRVESTYLNTLSREDRRKAYERFMAYDIAALVVCHGVTPSPECVEMAERYDRNLFVTDEDTSDFQSNVIAALHNYLAPRLTTHGVLVEIYGEGVLLMGDSGIGKSETALELIKRGHRLVADDAVEIKKTHRSHLVGTAPEIIRYYMELRGIGVINVRHIYGVGAVKPSTGIDLVVKMENWVDGDHPGCGAALRHHPGDPGPEPGRDPGAGRHEQPPEEDGLQRRRGPGRRTRPGHRQGKLLRRREWKTWKKPLPRSRKPCRG